MAKRLGRQWKNLIEAFTGGNPEIYNSLKKMYQQEGPAKASRGMTSPDVQAYIAKIMAETKI